MRTILATCTFSLVIIANYYVPNDELIGFDSTNSDIRFGIVN